MSVLTFGRSDPRWLVLILVLSTLIAIVLALAAWLLLPFVEFAGSHPFESETPRLLVVLPIILLWGGINAFLRARQNSANQARLDALDRQELEKRVEVDVARKAADAEFAEIRAGAQHAFRLAHGRRLVDIVLQRGRSLPRYIVIGPSGAGKTSILESANLALPYDPRESAVASARACRFVASDRAIFIDVAGELALGDGDDREKLWFRLLGLLHGLRRFRSINGVLVVVAAVDLAALDEEQRTAIARSLRRRLEDIVKQLGARVPVYLLLSKLDRVPGFSEFFEHLGADERTQVWGMPIASTEPSLETTAAKAAFEEGYDDLVRRASTRQIGFLHAEPDEARRTLAFEFPAQLAALRGRLASFLDELLRRSRIDEAPMLRGVFLSSAMQDGGRSDALGAVLASTFALAARHVAFERGPGASTARAQARRRPYFLKRLFSEIILAEASAGSPTEKAQRAYRFRRYALSAGFAALVVLAIVQLWSTYREVGGYVADVMAASSSQHANSYALSATDDLDSKLVILDDLARVKVAAEANVSSGFDVVAPVRQAAEATYSRALNDLLLPPTLHALETLLADPTTTAAVRFESLKLYLLLGDGHSPPADLVDDLRPMLVDDFAGLSKDASSRQRAIVHLAALAGALVAAQNLDVQLVAQARRRLNAASVAQIGYQLVHRQPAFAAARPWRPIDYAGSLGQRAVSRLSGKLLSSGVPGAFTAAAVGDVGDATATISASLASDAWVFAANPGERPNLSTTAVTAGILKLYQADYIGTWDALLADFTVPTLPTASAAAETIAILEGPDPPIVQLLNAVAAETHLDKRLEGKLVQGLEARTAGVQPLRELTSGIIPSRAEIIPLLAATRKAISAHFASFREALARPKEGQGSEIEAILKGFDPLYRQLLLVGSGNAVPEPNPSAANTALTFAAIGRLPLPIRPYFLRLSSETTSLVRVNLRGRAAEQWVDSVRPLCVATITGAFPFDLAASREVPLGEFTRLFSPNGLIASFRRSQLDSLVDTSVRPWRWRDSHSAPSDAPDPTLSMFERAEAITRAFFAEGDHLAVRFTARPLRLDPTLTRFQFDIGGSSLVYANGPDEAFNGQWPPPVADAPATLSVQPEVDNSTNSLFGTGQWGLFRLLAQASKVAQAPDAMLFAFDMGRRRVRLKLITPTLQNAFDLQRMVGFTCPEF